MDEPPSVSFILTSLLVAALMLLSAIISAFDSAYASITADQLVPVRAKLQDKIFLDLLDHSALLLVTIRLFGILTKVGALSIVVMVLIAGTDSLVVWGMSTLFIILILALIIDLIPRIYGKRYALAVIQSTVSSLLFLVNVCRPFTKHLVDKTPSDFIEQEFGIDKMDVVAATENKGTAPDLEKDILLGITNIGKLTVRQVMRHREEISAIDASSNFASLMEYVNICGYSRIPVYKNTLDNVDGIIYIKDLLPFVDYPQEFQWQSLKRPGYFVRESRKIDALLKDFQEKRVHMAIVVDDSGKTIGLVTLEDLLEEIMGVVKDGAMVGYFTQKKQYKALVAEDRNLTV